MAASVNQVLHSGNSSESRRGSARLCVHCVCACWRACAYVHACARPCHLSTLDNPHPGQAQTAVFQNTAEGNYKLGQPLDHEAGSILQCILSPQFSPAKTGLDQVNNDSHLPHCDKNTSRRPALSPLGTAVLGVWLASELAPEVSGWGECWGTWQGGFGYQ